MLIESVIAQDLAEELRLQRPKIPEDSDVVGIAAWQQWVADVRGIASVVTDSDPHLREFYAVAGLPWPDSAAP